MVGYAEHATREDPAAWWRRSAARLAPSLWCVVALTTGKILLAAIRGLRLFNASPQVGQIPFRNVDNAMAARTGGHRRSSKGRRKANTTKSDAPVSG
jgi:hypothetical protein